MLAGARYGSRGPDRLCRSRALLLALGGLLEPLAHPKPGGVTRCWGQRNLTIWSFALSSPGVNASVLEACSRGCEQGCLASALYTYLELIEAAGVSENTSLGTVMLLVPLACTIPEHPRDIDDHARRASRCVSMLGGEDARAYYNALERLYPSHLGSSYTGPLPPVGSGRYPSSFYEILLHTSWDLVHRELLGGYEASRWVARLIADRGLSEETIVEAVLRVIAVWGDTLIARRNGLRAYLESRRDANHALALARRIGLSSAVNWIRRKWEERGWSPGAALDVVAAGIGLYMLWFSPAVRGPS